DSHLAIFDSDPDSLSELRGLGDDVELRPIPRPSTMQLLLRPDSPNLSDTPPRRAVVAGLDKPRLVDAGTGGGPGANLPAHAQTRAPAEPGYRATEPPQVPAKPDPERVGELLRDAGYEHQGGRWIRDGDPLRLTI